MLTARVARDGIWGRSERSREDDFTCQAVTPTARRGVGVTAVSQIASARSAASVVFVASEVTVMNVQSSFRGCRKELPLEILERRLHTTRAHRLVVLCDVETKELLTLRHAQRNDGVGHLVKDVRAEDGEG
jgi:hypothetical protein